MASAPAGPDRVRRAFSGQSKGPPVTDPRPLATGSPADVTRDDGATRESPWAAPTYEPHALHAAGRTFSVIETSGIAEAEAEGNTGGDAPNRLDQHDND